MLDLYNRIHKVISCEKSQVEVFFSGRRVWIKRLPLVDKEVKGLEGGGTGPFIRDVEHEATGGNSGNVTPLSS